MQRHITLLINLIFLTPFIHATSSAPWLTGPLLAPAGHTVPRGHTNFEFYGLDIFTNGHFDESGRLTRTPLFRTVVADPILTHGFTDWLDVQIVAPYAFNSTLGRHSDRMADVSGTVGLQILEQRESAWKPDLRFAIQEIFPTGRFEFLDPAALGTDATGIGAYQTQLALNFQQVTEFKSHFLRTRLSLTRLYCSPVTVHGFNSFGGSEKTEGIVNAGVENDADLAFEFTLTQHWVLVMEGYISQGDSVLFNGTNSIGNIGPAVTTLSGPYYEEALAPAIEYNFTANVGLIGGVWFPVKSRNTSDYMTYLLALNAYW